VRLFLGGASMLPLTHELVVSLDFGGYLFSPHPGQTFVTSSWDSLLHGGRTCLTSWHATMGHGQNKFILAAPE
jgi:hypothetical protein